MKHATIRHIALLLGALALPVAALAQAKLTLEQAVTTALEKNPVRKAAVFEQQAASADIKLARVCRCFPSISFAEAYQRRR